MNYRPHFLLLALVLLASILAGAENPQLPPRIKGNVRYSVRPNYSRFILLFSGPVQYREDLRGNILTLTVSGITSAPSELGANLQFQDGLIERALVSRVANAASRVVLTLRTGFSKYSIHRMDGMEALIVDILPVGVSAQSSLSVAPAPQHQTQRQTMQPRPIPRQSKGIRAAAKEPGQTQLIDIAAIARKQVEEPETPKASPATQAKIPAAAKGQPKPTVQDIVASTGSVVWLVLLSVSTIVTLVALAGLTMLALRRNASYRVSSEEQQLRNALLLNQVAAASRSQRSFSPAPDVDQEPDCLDTNLDLQALRVAEQYHRSQGDIELAVRLREASGSNNSTRRIRTIMAAGLTRKGKLTGAKKLGVGKGELELASKLQLLKKAFSEKEGTA